MSTNDEKKVRTPKGLGPAGRKLFRSVADEWELQQHELLVLIEACRVADRLDALAEAQAGAALTTTNARGDVVASPYLVEARQQQIVLARLLAALRLPDDDAGEHRPQRRGAPRGAYQPRGLSAVV